MLDSIQSKARKDIESENKTTKRNSKTKCNREIMKETDNKMEEDRNNDKKNMTGGQKNKNKKDDFPHQYTLLSHCCVHLGS